MPTYRLIMAYDGTDFSGWQIQPDARTVQEEIEKVLSMIAQRRIPIQGAGRTDAGVHALGQCASFRFHKDISSFRLLGALRKLLPEDISPLELHRVPDDFNARFSATARFYTYRLGLEPCAPFRNTHWRVPYRLDYSRMQQAMLHLRDLTDFSGFCKVSALEKGTKCTLRQLELKRVGSEIHLHIGANRFLHNMVRIIVGTLVDIGRDRWRPERMGLIIETGDRRLAGQTAPPQGLFFRSVEYPDSVLELPENRPTHPLDEI